ncbi:MAG TPA: hypothetical protein P5210_12650, partial [Draconibacterium sp.]|nr:hypothetical protein [Draconibacterium sp.]
MVSEKTKQQAADSITDKGIGFSVEYKGQELQFSIRKLVLKTLIQISGEVSKLVKYNYKTSSMDVILSIGENAKVLSRCVAIAVINSKPVKKKPLLTKFILGKRKIEPEFMNEDELTRLFSLTIESEQLKTLNNVIVTQMNTA